MADAKRRVASNVAGEFFVDSSCINCSVSRDYAPSIFGDDGVYAFVKSQPSSQQDILAAHTLSANLTETPAPLGITVGRWR